MHDTKDLLSLLVRPEIAGGLIDLVLDRQGEDICLTVLASQTLEHDAQLALAFLRAAFAARGVVRAVDLERLPGGKRLEVAGLVLVRQRPGSARGVIFITLEDETGTANLIVWPKVFERFRKVVLGARLLRARGRLQKEGRVIHLVCEELIEESHQLAALTQGEVSLTQEGLARADEVRGGVCIESRAIGQQRRDARAARLAKILPKSRDFH